MRNNILEAPASEVTETSDGLSGKFSAKFPSLGWTTSYVVPEGLIGSQILFLGSEENKAELILIYQTPSEGAWRLVLGHSELGMWIESRVPHHSTQDAA